LFGSGWTRFAPAMLLVDPGTIVRPVAPGTLGSAAWDVLLVEPGRVSLLPFVVIGAVVPDEPVDVLGCAIATPRGAANKAAAINRACDLDIILTFLRPGRLDIQAATDR
jgi:hypothetical protein